MQGSWDGSGGRKRSDPCGAERLEFLQALVSEYQDSTDQGACDQVLANLANFASDPSQAPFLLALQVPALFSDAASSSRESTAEFGMGGLCNLSADPRCRVAIEAAGGVEAAVRCLSRSSEETVLSAITALVLLQQQRWRSGRWVAAPAVVQCMLRLQQADSARLRTLATLFLEDCCSPEQVEEARRTESQSAVGIPLPPGPPPPADLDLSLGKGP